MRFVPLLGALFLTGAYFLGAGLGDTELQAVAAGSALGYTILFGLFFIKIAE